MSFFRMVAARKMLTLGKMIFNFRFFFHKDRSQGICCFLQKSDFMFPVFEDLGELCFSYHLHA